MTSYQESALAQSQSRQHDRSNGALFCLTVGDALGATLEFKRPGTFEPITDPHDQMQRYLRWWRDGHFSVKGYCFDSRITTGRALSRFEKTGESSRTTHGARACVDACRYMAGLIVGAINGASKDELISAYYAPIADAWEKEPLCEEMAALAAGSFMRKEPPEIKGSGYVVASLEAALWAFATSDSFEVGALMAVNLGDDADTTSAVYGQIAGAFYGAAGIPARWLELLAMRGEIERLADGLVELAL